MSVIGLMCLMSVGAAEPAAADLEAGLVILESCSSEKDFVPEQDALIGLNVELLVHALPPYLLLVHHLSCARAFARRSASDRSSLSATHLKRFERQF